MLENKDDGYLDPELVLKEAEEILFPSKRPLKDKLDVFREKYLNSDTVKAVLGTVVLYGYAAVWTLKEVATSPIHFVNELRHSGYQKAVIAAGLTISSLPLVVIGDSLAKGEPIEKAALLGICTWGGEGIASMALRTSLRDGNNRRGTNPSY